MNASRRQTRRLSLLKLAGLAAALLALQGCAGLVSRLEGGTPPSAETVPVGLTYYLPAKLLQAEFEFQVTGCSDEADGQSARIAYSVRPVLTEYLVPDYRQRYLIRYEELNALTKVTDAKFTLLPNGMLGSVNAAIDDRSGAIVGNVIDVGTKVVRGLALGAVDGGAGLALSLFERSTASTLGANTFALQGPKLGIKPKAKPFAEEKDKEKDKAADTPVSKLCNAGLLKVIGSVDELRKALALEEDADAARKSADAAVAAKTDVLVEVRQAARAIKKEGTALELKEAVAQEEEAIKALEAATSRRAGLGKSKAAEFRVALAKALSALQFSARTMVQPEAEGGRGSAQVSLNPMQMAKILSPAGMEAHKACEKERGHTPDCRFRWPNASVEVSRIALQTRTPASVASAAASPDVHKPGLFYRPPASAWLRVCTGPCPDSANAAVSADYLVHQQVLPVPQFGDVAALSLTNRLFDDNSLKVVFSGDGGITSVDFAAKARAEAASAAAAGAADKYLSFVKDAIKEQRDERGAQRDERKADQQARQDELKGRLETLKTLREIELKRAGVADNAQLEKDRLEAEKARLALEIEIVGLRRQLEQARAGAGTKQ